VKLYIKQKVFSWRERFTVKDEAGADRYFVEGKLLTLARTLTVCDEQGRAVAQIHRKVFSWRPRYYLEIGGQTYQLVRKLTFFRPSFYVEGLPWQMEGDFLGHDYAVTEGLNVILRLSKYWFAWGDSYELDIADPANELLCLCIALGVDCMQADADGRINKISDLF